MCSKGIFFLFFNGILNPCSKAALDLFVYICDLSSCAQSVAICWGKKEERKRKKQRRERSMRSDSKCFGAQKQKKQSLFSTSVRSFEPQNWSVFPLFFRL